MTTYRKSADASYQYRESASADYGRMDSAAVYGNLADITKNAIVLLPPKKVERSIQVDPNLADKGKR